MKPAIKTKTLALGLCLSLLSPLALADSFKASEVEKLRKQGKAQQAYELALKYRDELEGDVTYDYYYGLAAIDAGKISEGLLALERVVLVTPENFLARLELGRAYFLLKEDTRARQEFETVLAAKPPETVVNNVKDFIRIIRLRESVYKSSGSAYVEVALGHDTNINSAPAGGSFFSPLFSPSLGLINVSGNSTKERDDFLNLTAGGKLTHPFEPGKQLFMGVDVSARYYSTDEQFETETLNVYAGVKWRKEDSSFSVTGQVQEFELSDTDNRNLVSLSGDWTQHIDRNTDWKTQLQVAQIRYPSQSLRSSTLYILGTGLTHQYAMKWNPIVSGNIYLGFEDAQDEAEAARATAQRNFGGLRFAMQLIPAKKLSISAALSAELNHYRGENIVTGKTRNEVLYQASVSGRYLVDDNWSLGAGLYYTRNDSNTLIFDYDRTRAQVSARYTF